MKHKLRNVCRTVWVSALIVVFFVQWLPLRAAAIDAGDGVLPSGLTDGELAEAIDAFLSEHQDNHAAVAVSVFRGEDDVLTRFFGEIDSEGTPLGENCVLEWGSTTKLTVWVSAMQLAEAGKLDLNADIQRYLPEGFLKNLRYDGAVTMLHLMNHNAGFQETDFVLEVLSPDEIVPLGEYLAANQPAQVFAPGSVCAYSNWGAALAGYIVECVAGMPYWEYVQEHIFKPLGMERSAIAADLHDNAWVQQQRDAFASVLPDGSPEPENKVYILPYPAGMCVSTLSDFALFAKALLTRDSRLLSAEGFDLLYSASSYYTGTDLARSAHGFLVDYDFAVPVVGHDGNTVGGSSRLILDLQDGVGMVVLTNQLGGSLYRTKMAKLVFGEGDHHAEIDGYYIPARNIFRGRMKLMNNLFLREHCHITTELADGIFVNVLPDRLEISMTDYLRQPDGPGDETASTLLPDYRVNDALAVIWFVALGYTLVSFLLRLILAIIARVKKRRLPLIAYAKCAYSLLLPLCILPIFVPIPPAAAVTYLVLLGAAGIALCFLERNALKGADRPKRAALPSLLTAGLMVCYAVTLVNVLIWDLV